jgi:4-amino-4-deoxy-L-arabinose transferase-like glycosyltransferase
VKSIRNLFWASLLIKLAVSALVPLTNDEAYYWVWSLHPQLSYYDHPPMVAWLFTAGRFFDVWGSMIRWPAVLLGHATLAIWLRILQPYLDERQRYWWLWLALLSPLIGGSNLLLTPDLPLMFFYALTLHLLLRWQEAPEARLAAAIGFSFGLGFTSKYMMVLFPMSLLPWMLASHRSWRPFLRHLPLMILGALAGSAPVWLWNLQNDFASFRFQTAHGLGRNVWKPSWTLHYIGAQIGLIFPVLLYWALKAKRKIPLLFHFLAWVPLIFFFFTTFRGYVEANWPIVAYAPIFALALASFPRNVRGVRFTATFWGVALAGLVGVVVIQPGWSKPTKFKEFHQFDNVIVRSREISPVYARTYQMAAKMHFELKRPIYKLRGMNRKDFYDYLPESDPQEKLYYVALEKGEKLPLAYQTAGHKVVERIPIDDVFEFAKVEAP